MRLSRELTGRGCVASRLRGLPTYRVGEQSCDDCGEAGITPGIARRRTEYGSGLGVTRRVVERTNAWLHQFRRLRVRFERRADIHEAFMKLGCCLLLLAAAEAGLSSFC